MGVQDRAVKLCPANNHQLNENHEDKTKQINRKKVATCLWICGSYSIRVGRMRVSWCELRGGGCG